MEDGGGATKSDSTMLEEESDEAVFCFGLSRKAYEATRRMLVESGVVGESGGDRRHVGFMHQLGQRCVRESRAWLAEGRRDAAGGARSDMSMWRAVMREVRNALERYFNRTRIRGDPRRYWLELRDRSVCRERAADGSGEAMWRSNERKCIWR